MGREHSFAWTGDSARSPDTARHFLRTAWIVPQALIALYGLATIVYLLARYTVGEQWRLVEWANNFVPWLALGGLLAALLALFSRWRWLLAGLQLPLLAAFVLLYGGLLLPHDPAAVDAGAAEVRVATYNIHGVTSDPAQIADAIRALDADVVGMVEVRPEHAEQIRQAVGDAYPYQVWQPLPNVHGVGFISRYPILEQEVWLPVAKANLHLRIVLDVDGTPVTVFVAHPPSPTGAFFPLGYDDGPRNRELAILHDRIAAEQGPVLLLCDCNMSDQSDPYRALDALLDDAFRTAGQGFGFSFPFGETFLPPLVRIDYVWFSGDFAVLDARPVGGGSTSDHRPVVADLALRQEAAGS